MKLDVSLTSIFVFSYDSISILFLLKSQITSRGNMMLLGPRLLMKSS